MKVIKEKYYDFAISDFDGTIFNSYGMISDETIKTVNEFIDRGGTFCICTGRMTASIIPFLHKFSLNRGYVISYNGAEIANVVTGEKIYKNHIDTVNAVKILQFAEENGFNVLVYPNDIITCENLNEYTQGYFKASSTNGCILNGKVSEYMQKNHFTTGKALFLTGENEEVANKILNELPKIIGDDFNVIRSNKYHVDVMKKGVSKGDTIIKFSKLIGKDLEKLVCFGDEMNDESMLKVAALALVPSNGAQALKEQCDLVIDSCDNDGVRKAIEKYCI